MRNLIIVILLFIGSVSAQTYHPANLKVVDSIKVGTSANSVWWTNMFAGSWIQTNLGLDYTMDGTQEYSDTLYYYVDEDGGSNANTGLSTGQAWETLVYADANARIPTTGDTTVIIALDPRDTWALSSNLEFAASGSANNLLIWDGSNAVWSQPSDTATIQHNGAGLDFLQIESIEYVTLQNLIVDGSGANTTCIAIGEYGDETAITRNITIQNCDIKNAGSAVNSGIGIVLSPDNYDVRDIVIRDNWIHDIGTHAIAVYKATSNVGTGKSRNILITGNTVDDWRNFAASGVGTMVRNETDSVTIEYNTYTSSNTANFGVSVEQANSNGGRYSTNLKIRYNDFTITEGTGIQFDQGDTVTAQVYGNIIRVEDTGADDSRGGLTVVGGADDWTGASVVWNNNTIINEGHARGILHSDYPVSFLTVRNNLIYSNDGHACYQATDFANVTHTNNLYYRVGTTYSSDLVYQTSPTQHYTTCGAVQVWEATAQCTDPTFTVDFTNLNLQTGSPAIDNGVAVAGYTEDRQGVAVVNPPNIGQSETTEDP